MTTCLQITNINDLQEQLSETGFHLQYADDWFFVV